MAECSVCGNPAHWQHRETGEFYCGPDASELELENEDLINLEEENKK